MKFSFHPEAGIEFNQAIEYYEQISSGLGLEVYLAIERAVSMPKAWTKIDSDIRRSLVNRFPFGVLYSEFNHRLMVIAVMHLHRHPDYWKTRR